MPDESRTGHADSEIPENHLKSPKPITEASPRMGAAAQKASACGVAGLIPETSGLGSRKRGMSDAMTKALFEHIDLHYIGSKVKCSVYLSWQLFHHRQTARGAKQIPSYDQFRRAVKLRVQQQQTVRRRRA